VASALERDIFEGRLAPGAKLPTEKALAGQFGVSRSAVREAIAQLRSAQLLQTRHGLGTFVVSNPSRRPLFALSAQGFDHLELCHIFELRTEVEAGAAALAARHRTSTDLERMRAALDRLARAVRENESGSDADMAFHTSIAAASGNRFFEEFLTFFADRMAESISVARSNSARVTGRARLVQHEHQSIYDAIAAGEPEQARTAMQLHLQNARRRLGLSRGRPAREEEAS
jgi:DNA-binding FadR family transcriptional regulator